VHVHVEYLVKVAVGLRSHRNGERHASCCIGRRANHKERNWRAAAYHEHNRSDSSNNSPPRHDSPFWKASSAANAELAMLWYDIRTLA